jgi:predicted alpha/beta superfamily hydrolase
MKRNAGRLVAAGLLAMAAGAFADGDARGVLSFSVVSNVGVGRSVFVVGNQRDLGNWAPVDAVKLRYTAGDVWTGQVAVVAGAAVEFKFISRNDTSNEYCNAANVQWSAGANLTTSTPPLGAAYYGGKTVFYYSGWTQVFLLASTDGVAFTDHALAQVSTGRFAGEFLYRGDGIGSAGGSLEFVLHNGAGSYDKAPYGGYGDSNYFTRLDAFVLQGGGIFNYWPAPSISPPQIVNAHVFSTVNGVTGRGCRIYLPRGYAEHTGRRYPVLYLQDGTNVFDPGSANGSWSADATATREISQGRLRETILVALDNIPDYRRSEYNPPTDTYVGQPAGTADKFLRYLFDNVRPTVDVNYRTLTNRANTLVGGSSMGGIFSIYAAHETNVFGGVLAMSPALTRAPNYTAALWSRARLPVRIYLDTGSAEGQVGLTPGGDYWGAPWEGYNIFLAQGYAVNEDLLMRIGCGHQHNEAAWSARLPGALSFLLDVRDEPSPLLAAVHPPPLAGSPTGVLTVPTLRRHAYRLETASSLVGPAWIAVSTSAVETLPWGETALTSPPPAAAVVMRVAAESRP